MAEFLQKVPKSRRDSDFTASFKFGGLLIRLLLWFGWPVKSRAFTCLGKPKYATTALINPNSGWGFTPRAVSLALGLGSLPYELGFQLASRIDIANIALVPFAFAVDCIRGKSGLGLRRQNQG